MNLREICKERLLSHVVREVAPEGSVGWKVVLVDPVSAHILAAACWMKDLLEENVASK
jgi:hypothetical protein